MDEVTDERCSVMLLVTLHHDQVLVSIMCKVSPKLAFSL